jgi:hypothetical protein
MGEFRVGVQSQYLDDQTRQDSFKECHLASQEGQVQVLRRLMH